MPAVLAARLQPNAFPSWGIPCHQQQQAKLAQGKPPISGVAKYLASQLVTESKKPVRSGVAKYLSKQTQPTKVKPPVSSVSRYLEAQTAAASNKPAVTSVSKYIVRHELLDEKQPQASGVAKYLSAQSALPAKVVPQNDSIFERVIHSGVAKYLEKQAQLALEALAAAEKSLVGEYIPAGSADDVSKIVNEPTSTAKGAMTGVSRYLETKILSAASSNASHLTGVQKYLLQHV